ncbi:proline rich protein 5MeD [Verticillium dahliae VdLs.17]|uniref:Proline rich protein 5MeD n=1 Tax=Verticillium dahliae (strain VdLs.17 / ATCC MYA-4575 / FGSC 10137) TaxID=498257 RepID=G2X0R2_VERDV|nr:proline rich protein 5MeD [Verticillium dahliae VdLs.17]EGY22403.1 proline rich protein 5MeD [Verticillium dahliae VdLs.17]
MFTTASVNLSSGMSSPTASTSMQSLSTLEIRSSLVVVTSSRHRFYSALDIAYAGILSRHKQLDIRRWPDDNKRKKSGFLHPIEYLNHFGFELFRGSSLIQWCINQFNLVQQPDCELLFGSARIKLFKFINIRHYNYAFYYFHHVYSGYFVKHIEHLKHVKRGKHSEHFDIHDFNLHGFDYTGYVDNHFDNSNHSDLFLHPNHLNYRNYPGHSNYSDYCSHSDHVDFHLGSSNNIAGNSEVNALGYNARDDYLYAVAQNGLLTSISIIRLNARGDVSVVVPQVANKLALLGGFNAGDVDENSQYWISTSGNDWYQYDLRPGSATYAQQVAYGTLPLLSRPAQVIADWAYVPGGGNFLWAIGTASGGRTVLMQFSRSTKRWTQVRDFGNIVGGTLLNQPVWGAVYASANGFLYGTENLTGQVWRFPVLSSTAPATSVVTGSPATLNDGARCLEASNLPT